MSEPTDKEDHRTEEAKRYDETLDLVVGYDDGIDPVLSAWIDELRRRDASAPTVEQRMITHSCPECGHQIEFPEYRRGQTVTCAECEAGFRVPETPPPGLFAKDLFHIRIESTLGVEFDLRSTSDMLFWHDRPIPHSSVKEARLAPAKYGNLSTIFLVFIGAGVLLAVLFSREGWLWSCLIGGLVALCGCISFGMHRLFSGADRRVGIFQLILQDGTVLEYDGCLENATSELNRERRRAQRSALTELRKLGFPVEDQMAKTGATPDDRA